jgi:5'-deoxynucleotidase YfbR-like HD superfamily hydrolase
VATLTLVQDNSFDQNKCVRMALIHDIGEAIIGDITPSDGISKGIWPTHWSIWCRIAANRTAEDKHRRESLAVDYLTCLLKTSNPSAAAEIKSLFEEFEENKTPEAKFVKEIDAFECLVQAEEYEERAHKDLQLGEFLPLESRISSKDLSYWTKLLAKERNAISSKKSTDTVIVFVIGGPGVGKGTQCSRLAADLGFEHISVGDLLREEARRPSSVYANFINKSIKESVIIPAQLTCDLVKLKINAAKERGIQHFLIDGFPRSVDQVVKFEEKVLPSFLDYRTLLNMLML